MESFVDGLSAAQARAGHAVKVVSLNRGLADGQPMRPSVRHGVEYVRLRRIGPRRYPMALGLLRAVRGAEIIHVHGLDAFADFLVATKGRHGARVGISTHGGYFHTDRHWWLKRLWLRTVTATTLQRADAVWYTSQSDRTTLSAASASGAVLQNGVDTARFAGIVRRPQQGRWVVPGRIAPHKGHGALFDAIAVLPANRRPKMLRVLGTCADDGYQRTLRNWVERNDLTRVVQFVGRVSQDALAEELGAAELAVFPSCYEGFGIALVETMAAGVPVLVNDIPAFRELIAHETSGLVLSFANPEVAANAMMEILSADTERWVRNARRTAQEYSWDAIAPAWDAAYTQMERS